MAKVAVLFLTPKCNMHCDFCGADAGFQAMPMTEAVALIDQLAIDGFKSVVLGGGEPFLWPYELATLARHSKSCGLITQVGTNGTLAPFHDAGLRTFDRWILPMEALDESVHNRLRHHEDGHLAHITRLLERLRKNQVEATVSSLVSKENIDNLLEVGAFLSWYQKNGGQLHAWHLYRFLPVGRGGALHADRFATGADVFNGLGALLKQRFSDLKIFLRPDMYHSKEVSFYWWQGGEIKSHASLTHAA